jgi:hypothetical protein
VWEERAAEGRTYAEQRDAAAEDITSMHSITRPVGKLAGAWVEREEDFSE